jgi:hypothetical protein
MAAPTRGQTAPVPSGLGRDGRREAMKQREQQR